MKREVSQNLGTSLQLKVIHLGGQLSSLCQGKSSLQELLDDEDGEGDGEVKEPDAKKVWDCAECSVDRSGLIWAEG